MNSFKLPGIQKIASVLIGFAILFSVYHFPEILQNHYQKPLILLFESCMLLFTFWHLSSANRSLKWVQDVWSLGISTASG